MGEEIGLMDIVSGHPHTLALQSMHQPSTHYSTTIYASIIGAESPEYGQEGFHTFVLTCNQSEALLWRDGLNLKASSRKVRQCG